MSSKLKAILVHESIDTSLVSLQTLGKSQLIVTDDILKSLAVPDLNSNIDGLILNNESSETTENTINAIRKATKKTWMPIAIYSKGFYEAQLGSMVFEQLSEEIFDFLGGTIKPSVLVIEDEKSLQDILFQALTKHYEVDIAGDGIIGLEKALKNAYDIILTDYNLPKLNGDKIIKNLRTHEIKTPIIMITAFDKKELELSSLSFGASEYLPKPISIKAIRKTIVDVLLNHEKMGQLQEAKNINKQNKWVAWREAHGKNLTGE